MTDILPFPKRTRRLPVAEAGCRRGDHALPFPEPPDAQPGTTSPGGPRRRGAAAAPSDPDPAPPTAA